MSTLTINPKKTRGQYKDRSGLVAGQIVYGNTFIRVEGPRPGDTNRSKTAIFTCGFCGKKGRTRLNKFKTGAVKSCGCEKIRTRREKNHSDAKKVPVATQRAMVEASCNQWAGWWKAFPGYSMWTCLTVRTRYRRALIARLGDNAIEIIYQQVFYQGLSFTTVAKLHGLRWYDVKMVKNAFRSRTRTWFERSVFALAANVTPKPVGKPKWFGKHEFAKKILTLPISIELQHVRNQFYAIRHLLPWNERTELETFYSRFDASQIGAKRRYEGMQARLAA